MLLATSLAWFLAAAAAVGLLIAWLAHDDGGFGFRRRYLWPIALLLPLVIALRLGFIAGDTALWVESALYFLGAYLIGAFAGWALAAGGLWLRRRRAAAVPPPPAATKQPPLLLPPPAASPIQPAVDQPIEAEPAVVGEVEPAKPRRRRKPTGAEEPTPADAAKPPRRRRKPPEG